MKQVSILYPPFTQPSLVYPGAYVVAELLDNNGFSSSVCDLNADFFQNLSHWCENPTEQSEAIELWNEIEKHRKVSATFGRPVEEVGIENGFFRDFQNTETYNDFFTYKSVVNRLNAALYYFGRSIGYRNLMLDRFEADASLEDIYNLEKFVNKMNGSILDQYFQRKVNDLKIKPGGVIGISASFRTQLLPALLLGKALRKKFKEEMIVLGGAAVTCLRHDQDLVRQFFSPFDILVFGPNETELLGTIERWFMGVPLSPRDSNMNILVSKNVRRNQRNLPKKVNPKKPWLNRLAEYMITQVNSSDYFDPRPVFPIPAARGCYWNKCTFCFEYGNDSRGHISMGKEVVDSMEIALHGGFDRFFIGEGAVPPDLAKAIGREIRDRKLPVEWYGFFRLEKRVTKEVIETISGKGGARLALYGLETASQKIQNDMKKGVLMDRATEILKHSAENGIWNHVLLMYGYPTENKEDADQTFDYLRRYADRIHSVASAVFTLDKASELFLKGVEVMDTLPLSGRNKSGLEYYVKTTRTTNYKPGDYRNKTLRYAAKELPMRKIIGLMHGHELWFYKDMVS